eukprot:s2650_g2.t1
MAPPNCLCDRSATFGRPSTGTAKVKRYCIINVFCSLIQCQRAASEWPSDGSLWPPVEAMSYSRGVLMYNFNEDRFGEDLQHKPKVEDAPKMSVSHTVHNWKTPSAGKAENPSPGLDRHVLFGHTGDMRDPHTNLQKVDFMTTNQTGGYLVIRFASIYVKVMQPTVYLRMMQERHNASQSTARLFCFLTSQRAFVFLSFGLFGAALYKGCLMKCFRSQCR